MATKTCPECGADVPASAARCKECFHDFQEAPTSRVGPILLLAAFAAMSLVGALVFWLISMRPLEHRVLVDEGTQAVIFTTQYRSGPITDRLDWSDIVALEYTIVAGEQQIVAITIDGDRRIIQRADGKPLRPEAERFSRVMNKPIRYVDPSARYLEEGDE